MSPSAVDIVRAFVEEPDARPDYLAPDVEFFPLTNEAAYGPAAVIQTLDDIAEHFHTYHVEAEQLIAIDAEHVLVHLRRTGIPLRSDVPITDRFAQIVTVRARLITRIESFRTPEEATKSVHQPPSAPAS